MTAEMEIVGCHLMKQDAIDQMVAVSNDEGIEPGGELEIEDEEEMEMQAAAAQPIKLQAQVWLEAGKGEKKRTISGIAVPYGVDAVVTGGEKVRIEAGALPTEPKPSKVRKRTKGLGNHEVTLSLYMSYQSSETYATLSSLVGTTTNVVVKPATGAESATNPGFTLTGAFLAELPVINATMGELSTIDVTFVGGAYTVDTTP